MAAAPGAPPAVLARDLRYAYGERVALDGLSLEVPDGAVFGLLGPNGSGKSTFITLLAAMTPPAEGALAVFGEAPAPALRQRLGTVFQENTQDPLMTVAEHLHLAAALFGVPRAAAETRTGLLLTAFGLDARRGERIAALSGGMRRRLEVARALLHAPDLLVLDEPTTGVDPDEREALWAGIRASGVRTVLLATNDLSEADSTCDYVAFLRSGRIVAEGAPAALKAGLRREAVRITWDGSPAAALATLESWPGVGSVTVEDEVVHVTVDDAAGFVPRLFALAPGAIRAVAIEPATLQDAYFQHVGRRERALAGVAR